MIAFQYSDVENSLRLSVYQHKLVLRAVESNYERISALVVAWNRPDVPKRKLSSVIKPVNSVELLITIENSHIWIVISLASCEKYFFSENFKLADCPDIFCVYLLNGELTRRWC